MSCWCDPLDYVCSECEKYETWKKLNPMERMKLLAYKKMLESNTEEKRLLKQTQWIIDHNLCVSMIPKKGRI